MATRGGEENMSDELVNNNCCVCAKKNTRTEAEIYCVGCKDYYCTKCLDVHSMIPATEGHTLLDKSHFKSGRSSGSAGALPIFPIQRCEQHKSEVLTMYCKDHDEVACALCIALIHRRCTSIQFIPDDIGVLYSSTELEDVKIKIIEGKRRLEKIKKADQNKITDVKMSFKTAVENVKSFRKELESLLDNMEQDAITEITKEFNRIEGSLTKSIHEVDNLIDSLNEVTSQLMKSEGNTAQKFVSVKTSKKLTNRAFERMKTQSSKQTETLSFTADASIKTYVEQMKSIGSVTVVSSPKKSFYTVKQQREIKVVCSRDKNRPTCNIVGLCLFNDDDLLLTDELNKNLKRFIISKEKVTDCIDLTGSPQDVCQVSGTEAAVLVHVDANACKIHFVSVRDKMSVTRTLSYQHRCWGLAYKEGNFFVSDGNKTVYIYDITGKQKRKIENDADGNSVFDDNRQISSCAGRNFVYVADFSKGVIVLDSEGNYLITLKDKQVEGYQGVCTDGTNVFVCGWASNNVLQIDDVNAMRPLGKVNRPLSICFDKFKTRLFIGREKITVIDLE